MRRIQLLTLLLVLFMNFGQLFAMVAQYTGTISVLSSQTGSNTPEGERPSNLFDKNKNTKWCSVQYGNQWYNDRANDDAIVWKTADPIIMNGYVLTTGGDVQSNPGRNWKNWTIYGGNFANDDAARSALSTTDGWTVLHQVENDNVLQGINEQDYTYTFSTPNTTAYQYYKVVIHDIKSTTAVENTMEMSELTPLYLQTPVNLTARQDPQNATDYYSTFYDHDVSYTLPEGAEAYIAELSGDVLRLTKIAKSGEVIPANNAVILKATGSSISLTLNFDGAVDISDKTNSLQGSDDIVTNSGNTYVLSAVDGVVGFYRLEAGTNVPAHKAYVLFGGGLNQAPRRMPFVFDQATGIENGQMTNDERQTTKLLRDGQLIIIRNGVEYTVSGQVIK